MATDIIDRLLTGNLSSEYANQLFTSTTGFTITEISQNVEETLKTMYDTITTIPNNENESNEDNKYILQCIILSMFLTKDDDECCNQLLTICNYFSYYKNLKHFRIIDCDINDEMLQKICLYFTTENQTKCHLELIDISYNNITDNGIQILSSTLIQFHHKTMKNIMCAANYLSDLGVVALSKSVALCENIEFVDISQQQSDKEDGTCFAVTNCLPLLSALINKKQLKGIELFHCGLVTTQLIDESQQILKDLLTSTPNLKVLQVGRTNLNHPKLLKNLLDALVLRGKNLFKKQCEEELLPIFQKYNITKDITLDIVEIIKLYIFDFYDDKFHLVLSQNNFDGITIVPVLTEAFSNKYYCVGRVDLTGNIFTFEDISEIGKAMINNPKMHSVSFDVKGYKNGNKIQWNWAEQMRSEITKGIYFVKGSSKDVHRGGFVRDDHSKIYWSTITNRKTHVCDPSRGTFYS